MSGSAWLPTIPLFCFGTPAHRKFTLSIGRRDNSLAAPRQPYRDLKERGVKVRIGLEAGGHAQWFERLLAELQFDLWIGDAAQISKQRVRKQKTDRQDAQLLLRLLIEGAHTGAGLGTQFLRHIERTRLLVHNRAFTVPPRSINIIPTLHSNRQADTVVGQHSGSQRRQWELVQAM